MSERQPPLLTPTGYLLVTMLRVLRPSYLLLPFGVTLTHQPFRENGRASWYTYREAFVFGVRVARWVVGSGPPTAEVPTPPTPEDRGAR